MDFDDTDLLLGLQSAEAYVAPPAAPAAASSVTVGVKRPRDVSSGAQPTYLYTGGDGSSSGAGLARKPPSSSDPDHTEEFSKLRISKRTVPAADVRAALIGRTVHRIKHVADASEAKLLPAGAVPGSKAVVDWITIGVLSGKGAPVQGPSGKYCTWRLTDFASEISVFLFGAAYEALKLEVEGSVFLLSCPTMLPANERKRFSLSVSTASQITKLGTCPVFAICTAMCKSGRKCTMAINSEVAKFCVHHMSGEYSRMLKKVTAGRGDVMRQTNSHIVAGYADGSKASNPTQTIRAATGGFGNTAQVRVPGTGLGSVAAGAYAALKLAGSYEGSGGGGCERSGKGAGGYHRPDAYTLDEDGYGYTGAAAAAAPLASRAQASRTVLPPALPKAAALAAVGAVTQASTIASGGPSARTFGTRFLAAAASCGGHKPKATAKAAAGGNCSAAHAGTPAAEQARSAPAAAAVPRRPVSVTREVAAALADPLGAVLGTAAAAPRNVPPRTGEEGAAGPADSLAGISDADLAAVLEGCPAEAAGGSESLPPTFAAAAAAAASPGEQEADDDDAEEGDFDLDIVAGVRSCASSAPSASSAPPPLAIAHSQRAQRPGTESLKAEATAAADGSSLVGTQRSAVAAPRPSPMPPAAARPPPPQSTAAGALFSATAGRSCAPPPPAPLSGAALELAQLQALAPHLRTVAQAQRIEGLAASVAAGRRLAARARMQAEHPLHPADAASAAAQTAAAAAAALLAKQRAASASSPASGGLAAVLGAASASESAIALSAALSARSLHADEGRAAVVQAVLSRADRCERVEAMEAAMAQVTSRPVTRWFCAECERWYDRAPEQCAREGHAVAAARKTQYAFRCDRCARRCTGFARLHTAPCAGCGHAAFSPCSVYASVKPGSERLDSHAAMTATGDKVEHSLRTGGREVAVEDAAEA